MSRPQDPSQSISCQESTRIDVVLLPWGETAHPQGDFTVDQDFAEKYIDGFETIAGEGHYPPVRLTHDKGDEETEPKPVDDGFIYGRLADLSTNDEGIVHTLELAGPVYELNQEHGLVDEWSPSFRWGWEHPHLDETIELAPRHIAAVSQGHLKNISPGSFYDMSEDDLNDGLVDLSEPRDAEDGGEPEADEATDNVEMSDIMAALEKIGSEVAALADRLSDEGVDESEDTEDGENTNQEDDEVEMSDTDEQTDEELEQLREENEQLKERLDELQKREAETELSELGFDDEETITELAELRVESPGEYASRLTRELAEQKGSGVTRLEERGSTGEPDQPAPSNVGDAETAIELAESRLESAGKLEGVDGAERSKMIVRKARAMQAN